MMRPMKETETGRLPDRELLEQQLAELPIAQYEFFETGELEFGERLRMICQAECPRYGKTWACPPAVGTIEECRDRCLSYPRGLLIVSLAEVTSISHMEECLATRPAHEAMTHEVIRLLQAQGLEVYGLSTESCAICEHCTYPHAPCRHKDKMLPCLESHGIVATALADKYGIEYLYDSQVVTWFSVLLYR